MSAKRREFWQSTKPLLQYKRILAIGMGGALLNAACFGTGLGVMVAAFALLTKFEEGYSLAEMIREWTEKSSDSFASRFTPYLEHLATQLPTDPFWSFVTILLVILALTVIGNMGRFIHEIVTLTVVMRVTMNNRARMFRRLIHAPMIQALQTGNSDHISRVATDTEILSSGHRVVLGKAFSEILKGVAALITAFLINWGLTLIALIAAPVIASMLRKFGKIIRRATERVLVERGKLMGAMYESLDGASVVKVHNAEGQERRRFSRVNRGMYYQEIKMRMARSLSSPTVEIVGMIGIVSVGTIAAWAIFRRNVPAAELAGVLFALANAMVCIKPLSNLNNQLHESTAAARRVFGVLNLPVEPVGIKTGLTKPPLPRHRTSVEFSDIVFTYPGKEEPALRSVSLSVKHGMETAIVGSNGSGKSTLLNMLPRLLEPDQGKVSIDGTDVQSVNLRSLRKQISVVTQQTVLFEGTIADNIAYGRRYTHRDKIVEAAKRAHADEFIQRLPQGYDTPLGEGGTGLSGGQRQRLCIARAILRDPAILILDEATSQIDADSEARINEALQDIRQGRTIFVIAHRLSTVVDADLIVVMHDGRIIDQGKHNELLERCEQYRILTQTQLMPSGAGN